MKLNINGRKISLLNVYLIELDNDLIYKEKKKNFFKENEGPPKTIK